MVAADEMVERAEHGADVVDEQRLAVGRRGVVECEATELELERGECVAEVGHATTPGF